MVEEDVRTGEGERAGEGLVENGNATNADFHRGGIEKHLHGCADIRHFVVVVSTPLDRRELCAIQSDLYTCSRHLHNLQQLMVFAY